MTTEKPISSPTATGGSGTFFEQHVGAQFLALLLVRGIPPLLKDCQVEEVHFQTENLGWRTDDVLVVGNRGEDRRRNLAAQVKRTFTVSSHDESCRKTFSDFWEDFNNQDIFDPESDRLALITLRGTNTLLDKFASLLDCARASTDGEDFERRLSVDGLLSKKARSQANAIKTIFEETAGKPPSPGEFWQFLCVLDVMSLDLNTQTAQHESWTKTLLAQTATAPDQKEAAESTWNELLQIVGGVEGMPAAGSYTYQDLPEKLRSRHQALAPQPGGHLRQLIDHSSITLEDIQTTIADSVEIRREPLEARILDSLEETQVTVISGAAGHGKSAVAKSVVGQVRDDYFCLAFRAEEFARNHIDQALAEIQDSLTANRLLGLLAGQGRKIILVDGLERLLESSERKAFTDLLRLAKRDLSLKLILTCRDYSVDTVEMSLLEQVAIPYEELVIPPFTDEELNQVGERIPELARPVESSNLRELLRSPYFLKIAARIDWSEDKPLPNSEREFRDQCWREVVRSDVDATGGMPRRRERVFSDLALRRAKELRPYVQCDDFDSQALEELRKDDLVSYSDETPFLAAPAHDVLEDWAIIHWLNSRFAVHEGDEVALANDIGGYPALRRGYRKWLGEMLELDSEKTDAFVLSAFKNEGLPSYFRDDTIISALLSSSAEDFLFRNRDQLLDDDGRLLVRVIHLLRVSCKTTPSWLDGALGLTSQLLVPTGSAWDPVLKIVNDELEALLPQHFGVLLGLVEDWSQQVTYWNPKPAGYGEAGKIVVRLLEDLDGYGSNDLRRRALKILAKIPEAVPEAFKTLLQGDGPSGDQDKVTEDFAELLLTESSSSFACRYFPQEMVDLAKSYFCLTDQDVETALENRRYSHSSLNIEPHFGIKPGVNYKFSVPASAIRGPFFPLLQSHPQIGVEFITDLMNHACSWYGEQKWPFDPLESAWKTELSIPEEDATVVQWANGRLYGMYRGATVAPYVLQSALMALEKWLLEIAEIEGVDLESWLLKLLRESNNVAVTAVVASVCVANPEKCGRAGLALLSSQDIIRLDRSRMAHDQTSPSMAEVVSSMQPKHKIYDDERKKSDDLPHRQSDLEYLAVKLQIDEGLHEEVWKIIDQHREELPPQEEQSERDHTWRLALHRMDVRGFDIEEVPASKLEASSEFEEDEEKQYFQFVASELEPDVQEISERSAERFKQRGEDLSLVNWGRSAWKGELDSDSRPWREMLHLAKERDSEASEDHQEGEDFSKFTRGGPGFIAAVCVRDHWQDMNSEDRSWCVRRLIGEIERYEDSDDSAMVASRGSMFPDRYAAYALSRVIQEQGIEKTDDDVTAAMATALTHSVTEVREYAAEGVGFHSSEAKNSFAMRCVGALAQQVRLVREVRERQSTKTFQEQLRGHELFRSTVPEVRESITAGHVDTAQELNALDTEEWYGRSETKLILRILGYQEESQIAARFYKQTARLIVKRWKRDEQNRYSGNQRYIDFEYWCATRIARFALKLETLDAIAIYEPLLEVVEDHPGEVADVMKRLIYEEDGLKRETPFWEVWQVFADRFRETDWISDLDAEYSMGRQGRQLLKVLLFGIQWKEDVRYWSRLQDQESRVEAFVQQIPPLSATMKSYCRFLYHIGEKSLPQGFRVVAERLETGDPSHFLTESNTVYYLESLLRRYVYGEPLRLKSDPDVREAVLYILDQLVEAGSSAAYQMRDDFVTPVSSNVV